MKIEEFNNSLRELFQELLSDGFKKRHICGLTLGGQNEPQFDGFLKGNNFGIKPLQRLVQNMGYDFNIVILPKEDNGNTKFVDNMNDQFISHCKVSLVEHLNNETTTKSTTIATAIDEFAAELFNEITK